MEGILKGMGLVPTVVAQATAPPEGEASKDPTRVEQSSKAPEGPLPIMSSLG